MMNRMILRVFPVAALAAMLLLVFCVNSAHAQRKKRKKKPDPPAVEQPEEPPEQAEATKIFAEGSEAEKAKEWEKAIELYIKAFEMYPDNEILFVIGDAYRKWADENPDEEERRVELYAKALEQFNKYVELMPEGRLVEPSNQRIEALSTYIKQVEDTKKAEEDAKREEEEAARKEKEEEEARKRLELEEAEGMQLALDAQLVSGVDQDLTAVARIVGGGLMGWGPFALEGRVSFEGFLPIKSDKGINATSITILDLGARYSFTGSNRFDGPFVSVGTGFGLISGKPREKRLSGDVETCMSAPQFDPADPKCTFDIDKDITFRTALAWGFAANKKTTVAVRLDLTYWWYSVADNQNAGSPPPSLIIKPVTSFSFLLGLEFMRWK